MTPPLDSGYLAPANCITSFVNGSLGHLVKVFLDPKPISTRDQITKPTKTCDLLAAERQKPCCLELQSLFFDETKEVKKYSYHFSIYLQGSLVYLTLVPQNNAWYINI